VWLSSCEQNSCQIKSDPFPDITKKFKRYQNEANDRESVSARKSEKSPSRKRENVQVKKQTKSSSSINKMSQKQSATVQDDENAPDMPVGTGKQ